MAARPHEASPDDSPARIVVSFAGDVRSCRFGDRLFYDQFRLFTGQQLPYAALMYVWGSRTPRDGVVATQLSDVAGKRNHDPRRRIVGARLGGGERHHLPAPGQERALQRIHVEIVNQPRRRGPRAPLEDRRAGVLHEAVAARGLEPVQAPRTPLRRQPSPGLIAEKAVTRDGASGEGSRTVAQPLRERRRSLGTRADAGSKLENS